MKMLCGSVEELVESVGMLAHQDSMIRLRPWFLNTRNKLAGLLDDTTGPINELESHGKKLFYAYVLFMSLHKAANKAAKESDDRDSGWLYELLAEDRPAMFRVLQNRMLGDANTWVTTLNSLELKECEGILTEMCQAVDPSLYPLAPSQLGEKPVHTIVYEEKVRTKVSSYNDFHAIYDAWSHRLTVG